SIRVAVYGTLMQGQGGQELAGISEGMTYLGPCQLRGELYDLGEYPGLLEGEAGVSGEIFALRDISVLEQLDRYEGCVDGNPGASLFVRRLMPVAGQRGNCWIYYYNGGAPRDGRIPSGDWAEHVRQRAACS
ncbi:MAG: gamma-glutamylcyclotransferase, partial [Verrucomicrobiaceae bacterium]